MRLLIIEDDKQLAGQMKTGLERQGFTVDIANTGIDGEEKAYVTDYDAALLDVKDRDQLLDVLKLYVKRAELRSLPRAVIDLPVLLAGTPLDFLADPGVSD